MDLTPGRQRLVFAVIVIVLVILCVFLIRSRHSGGTPSASGSATPSAPAQASGVPPTSVPSATPASTVGGAEIYQWLPFTAADLSAAAQTTVTFAKDYSTWSYTESANAYAATMSGLVNAQQLALIKSGYSTAGVQGPRTTDKQASTGSGTIDSINSFGTGPTITFYVTINEQLTGTQPTSTQSSQYAVTVTSSGGSWQVSNLQLANVGNH